LKTVGAVLLADTLRALPDAVRVPQSGAVTYAPPIRSEDRRLDWSRSAAELTNQIRALAPAPGAVAELGGQTFKILKAVPGADGALTVNCGAGTRLVIEILQAPGGKPMLSEDYLRGHKLDL